MYRDELEDDLGFESPLATFTRHYANCENRKEQAWKGWLKALECQYNPSEFAQAVLQIDYDYFGCDIVFLASAWGGPKFIKAVSPHVAWNKLERDENMAESVEETHPEHNNLKFSAEPSFWVWYFGSEHHHSEAQMADVEYCVETLLESGELSMTHLLPSYSFGRDITLRTALVGWDLYSDRRPFSDILTGQPISEDEAKDLIVAYCANGEELHRMFSEQDIEVIKKLSIGVDYSAPYPLSEHFQSVLHTQLSELPLGVVVAGMLMRSWDHTSDIVSHIMQHHSEILEQHFDVLYNLSIVEGVFNHRNPAETVAAQIFCNTPHFDIASCITPLLRESLEQYTLQNTPTKYFRSMLEHCASSIALPNIFTEEETANYLRKIFEVFSYRKNDIVIMENVEQWWSNPTGWEAATKWFDSAAQSKVVEFMRPIVDAGVVLDSRSFHSHNRHHQFDSNDIQAAQLMLNVFDPERWNETTRKLKM